MFIEQKKIKSDLYIFLTIISSLIIIGLLFIYSSSSVYALEKFGSSHYFVKKQMIGLVIGLLGLIFFRLIPIRCIKNVSPYLLLMAIIVTSLTIVTPIGHRIHGSSRWLFWHGISFQPSELLKMMLILYVAYFLSKKESAQKSSTKIYIMLLSIIGVVTILLLKQPDFGMAFTLFISTCMLFFISSFQIKQLFITALCSIPTIILLICWQPYRLKRITTFLNPWADPQGAGFQIIQSLIAIGAGNWFGLGISHSKQKYFYLPMQHTDFIFSIIAEETGFIGASLLILLYFLFLYFGLRIAWQLKDTFGIMLTLGFVLLTTLQVLINLAVTTGLAPTKGIGLPFISAGNSALIINLCMIGIIMNCVQNYRSI